MTYLSPHELQPLASGAPAPSPPPNIADYSSIALTATPATNTVAVTWTSTSAGQQTYAGPVDLMPDGVRLALAHMMGFSSPDPPAYHDPPVQEPSNVPATTSTSTSKSNTTHGDDEPSSSTSNVRRHQFGPVRIELPGEFGPAEQEATERAIEQAAEGLVQAATTLGQYVSRSVGSVVDARVAFTPPPPPPPAPAAPSWFGGASSSSSSASRNASGRQLAMHVVIKNGETRHEFNSFGSLARYVVQALLTGGLPRNPQGNGGSAQAPTAGADENANQARDLESKKGDEKSKEKDSSMGEIGEDLD